MELLESCSRLSNAPASSVGALGFQLRPKDRLPCFAVFSILITQILGWYFTYTATTIVQHPLQFPIHIFRRSMLKQLKEFRSVTNEFDEADRPSSLHHVVTKSRYPRGGRPVYARAILDVVTRN
jgi:hypothetical protein